MRSIQVLVCLSLIGLWGCTNNPQLKYTAALLEGSDWALRHIETNQQKQTLPADAQINMAFLEGRLTGNSACNPYSAPYELKLPKLQVGPVNATEKYCVHNKWEGLFFRAIQAAESCTLGEDSVLVVTCANDVKLHFTRRTLRSVVQGEANPEKLSKLLALFPDLGPQSLHFYSILKGTDLNAYPFLGETIPPTMFDLFDTNSANVFRQAVTLGTYAIGKIDSLYVLRVPGDKGSNSIALYLKKNNQLRMEMTLAMANDEPSVNIQQDAWIKDLNRDGKLEVILRQLSAPQGGTAQDVVRAFAVQPDGSFQPALQFKLLAKDYPLQNIK